MGVNAGNAIMNPREAGSTIKVSSSAASPVHKGKTKIK